MRREDLILQNEGNISTKSIAIVLMFQGMFLEWVMRIRSAGAIVAMLTIAIPVFAAETVTYTYDAKGRLTKVVKSGGPASGATTTYEHDKSDNRKRVTTTGAP